MWWKDELPDVFQFFQKLCFLFTEQIVKIHRVLWEEFGYGIWDRKVYYTDYLLQTNTRRTLHILGVLVFFSPILWKSVGTTDYINSLDDTTADSDSQNVTEKYDGQWY